MNREKPLFFQSFLIAFLLSIPLLCYAQDSLLFVMQWDSAPIDLSYLLDPPAGKHGFLDIRDGQFIFEDGTKPRFWGLTLSASACFPPHDQASIIAERLAQFGINLVRFENMDAPWADPSLFIVTANKNLILNDRTMDRLDYFMAELIKRGIYIYVNGLDSRMVLPGDNIPHHQQIPLGFGPYIHFVSELRDLHESYVIDFWTHLNPYLEREYRDIPAIVLTDLLLENEFSPHSQWIPYYQDRLETVWQDWCEENNIEPIPPFSPPEFGTTERRFYMEKWIESCNQLRFYLRSLSVKCPIGVSFVPNKIDDLLVQKEFEFTNVHALWNPVSAQNLFLNSSMLLADPAKTANIFHAYSYAHIEEQPFVVGKWGHPWPNQYRAELPLWMSAMANYQNWPIVCASAYSTRNQQDIDFISSPLDFFNDPAIMGLFPAAALLFHQQHLTPSKKEIKMTISTNDLHNNSLLSPQQTRPNRLLQEARIHTVFDASPYGSRIFSPTQPEDLDSFPDNKNPSFVHDHKRQIIIINTDKTQACIGNMQSLQPPDIAIADIITEATFSVFSLSSLDNQPLRRSKDILLTYISQAQNKDFAFQKAEDIYRLTNPGTSPIQILQSPARLFLTLSPGEWSIEAIDSAGQNLDSIPFQIQDETLSCKIGIHETIYYRLTQNDGSR